MWGLEAFTHVYGYIKIINTHYGVIIRLMLYNEFNFLFFITSNGIMKWLVGVVFDL